MGFRGPWTSADRRNNWVTQPISAQRCTFCAAFPPNGPHFGALALPPARFSAQRYPLYVAFPLDCSHFWCRAPSDLALPPAWISARRCVFWFAILHDGSQFGRVVFLQNGSHGPDTSAARRESVERAEGALLRSAEGVPSNIKERRAQGTATTVAD